MTMNHRYSPESGAPNGSLNLLSKNFSSNEGYRILSNIVSDEYKLLQETKKILEKRVLLDEQYARNLQDLTANADRIAWPVNTHPIASASRDVFLQWSHLATAISSTAEQFRKTTIDDLLKELIEQKIDSKKFLDEEKRQYDAEYRKAQSDVADAEKRYLDEAKSYVAKNNELTKLQTNARKGDDSRIKHLKESVIEKRGHVYRAHNEYTVKIREYNFVDKQYVHKVRNLLIYHEEIQLILNKSWQNLLDSIANYLNSYRDELASTMESLRKTIFSAEPRRCYDEICRIHSNTPPITNSPQAFNELLLRTSGLPKLKINQFIGDAATKQDIKQRIEKLTISINETIPKIVDVIRERQMSYFGRKNVFEQEQQIDYCQKKRKFDEELRDDLRSVLKDVGYGSGDDSDSDLDDDLTDRLEDQPYFHGVLPRKETIDKLKEKGDYLVRINDQGKIVLSVVWTDSDNPNNVKDAHFFINESNQMYSLNVNDISKPSVHELLSYYKRQKVDLHGGARLIRPIARPNYMINNDEVRTLETLGKGHFGQVARAEYRGKFVAVKILHSSSGARSAEERQSFINEANLLRKYKHKNIVKFLGIAAIRDPLMIMMELIEQGSLNTYLRNNDLRVSQLIQMCYDIAKGMEYLEKNNVIHRDLATRNCLIDKKGRIKVADFGLSRTLQSDEEYFTRIKEIPVRWWAVEIFTNAPYTNKSDVWSYGVTAWEVFSRAETPYTNIQQNHLVIDAIKRGERLKQPDKCPAKIFTIIASCWLLDPKDRPNFEKLVELFKKEKPLF